MKHLRWFCGCAPLVVLASCTTCTPRASEPSENRDTASTRATPPEGATPATEPVVEPQPQVSDRPDEPPTSRAGWTEAFPHVRVNTGARRVELDAYVSPLIHSGLEGRNYYLEQFVCIPNTKEHESLLVTEAKPSHLHAALLLLGIEPGRPVIWDESGEASDAQGPALRVLFVYENERGERVEVHPAAWTRHIDTGETMAMRDWVFSGSTVRSARGREFYEADAAGTVIGLASFGGETISWPVYVSDLEETGDLAWLARTEAMPPARTPVVVRVSVVE